MLVLTRGINETIDIEGAGSLTIVRVRDGRVRISFDMPGVEINRREITERAQKEAALGESTK